MRIEVIKKATKAIIYLVLHDPRSFKFAASWISSLARACLGHTTLNAQVPWLTFKAIAWLKSYLKPDMSVFEYGSGGSTIFLSKKVSELISVEHNKNWYKQVAGMLSREEILNCEYILAEPEKNEFNENLPYNCSSFASTLKEYRGMNFKKYVLCIEKYPDSSFDLVIVDGRARASCISHAISKIRPGGCLIVDNSDRQPYYEAISLLAGYKRFDFFGICPYSSGLAQTSVWKIKPKKLL